MKRCVLLALLLLSVGHAHAQDAQPAATSSYRGPEISVREVIRLALEAAHTLSPARAQELSKRARLAGLVPQLKLAARRGLQQDLSATSTLDTDRTNSSQGDDLTLEASLTFQLDRLVFAPEQVRLLAVERTLVVDRRKLIEDVVSLFFKRERVLRELSETPADDALRITLAELEALLDAFTNNGFNAALSKARETRN